MKNPDTNARKEETKKNILKEKKPKRKRRRKKKKEKRPQRGGGYLPETGRKVEFLTRNVKRNRNEIEAQKNQNKEK